MSIVVVLYSLFNIFDFHRRIRVISKIGFCRYKNDAFSVFHPQKLSELHVYFGLLNQQGQPQTKSYGVVSKFIQRIIKPSIDVINKNEADEREKLGGVISPLEMAKLTFDMVSNFSPNDPGNPTVGELNNMMSLTGQLLAEGLMLDAAFISNFAVAMTEAKNRDSLDSSNEGVVIELDILPHLKEWDPYS